MDNWSIYKKTIKITNNNSYSRPNIYVSGNLNTNRTIQGETALDDTSHFFKTYHEHSEAQIYQMMH